jgi:hypothetical protein
VSIAADGTVVAATWNERGVRLASGSAGGFGTPLTVQGTERAGELGTVAVPGGDWRLVWIRRFVDPFVREVRWSQQVMVSSPGGRPQPVSDAASHLRVDAAPDGSALATWREGDVTRAALSVAGGEFVPVPGAIPARAAPAVAEGGRALLVGGAGALTVRDHPPGGPWTEPQPVAGDGSIGIAADLAADGSAVVLSIASGRGVVAQRVGEGAFGPPIDLGAMGLLGVVGTGTDGRAVAAFGGGQTLEVRGIDRGAVTEQQLSAPMSPDSISVRADGAAAIAAGAAGVALRSADGTLGPLQRTPVGTATDVAYGNEVVAAGEVQDGVEMLARASVGDHVVELGRRPAFPDDAASEAPRLRILAGPWRVRDGRAEVPLFCAAGGCRGTLRAGDDIVNFFDLRAGHGAYAYVDAGRRRRLRLTASVRGGPDRSVRARLTRRSPRGCVVPPWRRALGDGLFATSTRVYLCRRGHRTLTLHRGEVEVAAAARAGEKVALTRTDTGTDLLVLDLATGRRRVTRLQRVDPGTGPPPPYTPLRVRGNRAGDVALAERVGRRVRIRVVGVDGDRLVDARPGIRARSLAITGTRVIWRRDGARRSARLSRH